MSLKQNATEFEERVKIETKRGYEFRGLEMIVTILFEFLGSGSAYLWEHRQSRGWSGCSDAGKGSFQNKFSVKVGNLAQPA